MMGHCDTSSTEQTLNQSINQSIKLAGVNDRSVCAMLPNSACLQGVLGNVGGGSNSSWCMQAAQALMHQVACETSCGDQA